MSFLMEPLMLFAIFGSGLGQPHQLKVLYIMNNNAGIETLRRRLTRIFRDWGFTDEQLDSVLNIMRLYPLDGEVRAAVTEAQRQDQSQDDIVTTDLNANRDKSLHQFALRTLEQNQDPQQYRELKQLLASVADGTRLGEGDFANTKTNIKELYRDTLNGFFGVVATTPFGASPLLVRESFKPDIIIVDEAAIMDEATLSIAMPRPRLKEQRRRKRKTTASLRLKKRHRRRMIREVKLITQFARDNFVEARSKAYNREYMIFIGQKRVNHVLSHDPSEEREDFLDPSLRSTVVHRPILIHDIYKQQVAERLRFFDKYSIDYKDMLPKK
ncbi:uncharacterized protein B0J16DRAFT_391066 [Fusarium flagelliforme]|uniref:uncharacterized protein n=1 Tax=Fusarium flagelliforme TaxID=2675880 RepID=UPI001E8CE95A|nr:uncharacterized protein B0J16DRAFT_391066 [Fusarium flagelliforme]KAH7197289.1 hypothetical protein B0J16DRAFT_391066 [Fusarium flagelliforme]